MMLTWTRFPLADALAYMCIPAFDTRIRISCENMAKSLRYIELQIIDDK